MLSPPMEMTGRMSPRPPQPPSSASATVPTQSRRQLMEAAMRWPDSLGLDVAATATIPAVIREDRHDFGRAQFRRFDDDAGSIAFDRQKRAPPVHVDRGVGGAGGLRVDDLNRCVLTHGIPEARNWRSRLAVGVRPARGTQRSDEQKDWQRGSDPHA